MIAFVRLLRRREPLWVIAFSALLAVSLSTNLLLFLAAPVATHESISDHAKATQADCDSLRRSLFGEDDPPDHRQSKTQYQTAKDNFEICQSLTAAKVTWDSATYTRWQAIAGIGGAIISVIAVFAAGLAAYFAKQAAQHTGTQARAAIESVKHAMKSSEWDLRSFLNIESVQLKLYPPWQYAPESLIQGKDPGEIVAIVKIKNIGRMPAQSVAVRARLFVEDKGLAPVRKETLDAEMAVTLVAHNAASLPCELRFNQTYDAVQKAFIGTPMKALKVVCEIRAYYADELTIEAERPPRKVASWFAGQLQDREALRVEPSMRPTK